jgi:hypothetical protein
VLLIEENPVCICEEFLVPIFNAGLVSVSFHNEVSNVLGKRANDEYDGLAEPSINLLLSVSVIIEEFTISFEGVAVQLCSSELQSR